MAFINQASGCNGPGIHPAGSLTGLTTDPLNEGETDQSTEPFNCIWCVFMRASVLLLYVCLLLNLSVRTVSQPSLAVKHWSLTSLIRPLLNHLSVCLTHLICSPRIHMSISSPPVLHQPTCTFPHTQQVPCFLQPPSLSTLAPSSSCERSGWVQ